MVPVKVPFINHVKFHFYSGSPLDEEVFIFQVFPGVFPVSLPPSA